MKISWCSATFVWTAGSHNKTKPSRKLMCLLGDNTYSFIIIVRLIFFWRQRWPQIVMKLINSVKLQCKLNYYQLILYFCFDSMSPPFSNKENTELQCTVLLTTHDDVKFFYSTSTHSEIDFLREFRNLA